MQILLLEDEYAMRKIVKEYLIDEGYQVDSYSDGERALDAIFDSVYDLLLLDVRVPTRSGFEILKEIRAAGIMTPAIFITSLKDTVDLEQGYCVGCCDYIRKPFDLTELKLRINQAIRSNNFKTANKEIALPCGYSYDTDLFVLKTNEKTIQLSKIETLMIELLIKNRGRVVTHQQFQNDIWKEYVDPANIRVQVNNLRKKTGDQLIESVRGLGYRIGQL